MGYEIDRFVKQPPKNLVCDVCSKVFQEPVHCISCQKYFCQQCVNSTIMHAKCKSQGLQTEKVNQFFLNKLNKLSLRCQFYKKGCQYTSQLLLIDEHLKKCEFNPDRVVKQEVVIEPEQQEAAQDMSDELNQLANTPDLEQQECQKCHAKLYAQDFQSHNCIQFLFTVIQHQNSKYALLQNELSQQTLQNQLLQNEYEEYKVESKQQVTSLEQQMQELKSQINNLSQQLKASALTVNSSSYMNLTPEQQSMLNSKKYIEMCQESLDAYHRFLQSQMQAMIDKTSFAFNSHKSYVLKTQKDRFSNQSVSNLGRKMVLSNMNSQKDLSSNRSKTPPPKKSQP